VADLDDKHDKTLPPQDVKDPIVAYTQAILRTSGKCLYVRRACGIDSQAVECVEDPMSNHAIECVELTPCSGFKLDGPSHDA
jgi:hypothetical protein